MSIETLLAEQVSNLGVSVEDYLLIAITLTSFIFTAVEFRMGIMLMFVISIFELVLFIAWGLSTTKLLYAVFVILIIMTLTILTTYQQQRSGF